MLYWMDVRENLSRQKRPGTLLFYPEIGGVGKLVAPGKQGYPGNPEIPGNSEDSEIQGKIWPHHYQISLDYVPHVNKVSSIARQTYGRISSDDMKDLDVNTAIWFFLCLSLFKLQFILGMIILKICDLPRINP